MVFWRQAIDDECGLRCCGGLVVKHASVVKGCAGGRSEPCWRILKLFQLEL